MQFRGRGVIFALIVATLFVPPATLIIPNFLDRRHARLAGHAVGVIVPGAASAFGVFFLRQFFLSLPRELEEAALLDGANQWQIFTAGGAAAVQAGAGHARRAVVPHQLERLPLAGLRAVQRRRT